MQINWTNDQQLIVYAGGNLGLISRTSQCRGDWCYFSFDQILVDCGGGVSRRRAALAFPDWHAI